MDFEAGIDTSARAVGHAHKRGTFVPSLCARPARACRASLSADTETGHPKRPFSSRFGTPKGNRPTERIAGHYSARLPMRYVIMDFEAGIDTSAHAVGHAYKRGNFVPSLCTRPTACLPCLTVSGYRD